MTAPTLAFQGRITQLKRVRGKNGAVQVRWTKGNSSLKMTLSPSAVNEMGSDNLKLGADFNILIRPVAAEG